MPAGDNSGHGIAGADARIAVRGFCRFDRRAEGAVLVQILFSALPGAIPAAPLGTNKNASGWGTAAATAQIINPLGCAGARSCRRRSPSSVDRGRRTVVIFVVSALIVKTADDALLRRRARWAPSGALSTQGAVAGLAGPAGGHGISLATRGLPMGAVALPS